MDPVTWTVLAIGIAGAATSAAGAMAQNRAIEKSMDAQAKGAGTQQQQLADQAALEKMKTMRTMQQLQGRVRVAAGESGATTGGSFAALENQARFDAGLNNAIIGRNLVNQQALVRSGFQANMAQLQSQQQNPLLSAFSGGMQGLQAGLAIGNALPGKTPGAPSSLAGDFPQTTTDPFTGIARA